MQIGIGLGIGLGGDIAAETRATHPSTGYLGQDDFTDDIALMSLFSLTPVVGSWLRHSLSTGTAMITESADALRGPGSGSQAVLATIAHAELGDGVFVELDMLVKSNNSNLTSNAVARVASDSLTFLAAGYNGVSWRIIRYVSDVATVLASYDFEESIGSYPSMRFEVLPGEQRLYRNGELILLTNEEDASLGSFGDGFGLRLGSINRSWTDDSGAQLRGIRVGVV